MHFLSILYACIRWVLSAGIVSWVSVSIALYTAKHQRILEANALKDDQNRALLVAKQEQEALVAKTKIEAESRSDKRDNDIWVRMDEVQTQIISARDYYKSECSRLNARIDELTAENKEQSDAFHELHTSYNSLLTISNADAERIVGLTETINILRSEAANQQTMIDELRIQAAHDLKERDDKIRSQDLKIKRLQTEINILKGLQPKTARRSVKPVEE
jgi:hypothetical protein